MLSLHSFILNFGYGASGDPDYFNGIWCQQSFVILAVAVPVRFWAVLREDRPSRTVGGGEFHAVAREFHAFEGG
jgi:hypothetical protein